MTLRRHRHPSASVGALIAFLAATVLSACSGPASPTATPSPVTDGIAIDQLASIDVSPVDYDGLRVVNVTFSTILKDRPVSLQRNTGGAWQDVAKSEQDKYGEVSFLTEGGEASTFRAVAAATTADGEQLPAIATPEAALGTNWEAELSTDFDGTALDSESWKPRSTGSYDAGGRQCAAPYPSNLSVSDGEVHLAVTEETDPARIKKAKAAGCEEDAVYRNAMISTEGRATIKSGIVAARVKFPRGQGMHGAVWLQSYNKSEIDFVESYGYGAGVTSVIHVNGKRYPAQGKDTYVLNEQVKDADWWDRHHVYSVEWDTSSVVFRVDGAITKRIDQGTPETDYFVVISNLTSDWEHKRFKKPLQNAEGVEPSVLPQSMSVDWVRSWTRS